MQRFLVGAFWYLAMSFAFAGVLNWLIARHEMSIWQYSVSWMLFAIFVMVATHPRVP